MSSSPKKSIGQKSTGQAPLSIAFIGLGTMGYPMAGHLAASGHRLHIYNRTPATSARWLAAHNTSSHAGHRIAASPQVAACRADWIILCVGNDEDVQQATLGENGVVEGLRPGACLINHGTSSVDICRRVSDACTAAGGTFLDAPVSGGQSGAEHGQLSIFVGGAETVVAAAQPVLACYAQRVTHMGPVGAGQLAKMVNQICVGGLLQGLAEGLAFGRKAGLDGKKLLAAISQGAAQSWQMDHRGISMLENRFDFGFAVKWMHKDLCLCLDEAERLGAGLPVTETVRDYYAELIDHGDAQLDSSALIKRLPS